VVEQEDPEQLASLRDAVGKRKVLRAGVGRPRRMVMDHDQPGCALADQRPEHVSQAGRTGAQTAARELQPTQDALPSIERDGPELFVLSVCEERPERAIDVLAARDRRPARQGPRHHPPPELDRCGQARRLAEPEPADADELTEARASQVMDPSELAQDTLRKLTHRLTRSPRPEQQCDQVSVAERLHSALM
jgi:hypothetical protein